MNIHDVRNAGANKTDARNTVSEHEWQLQERALREEREGARATADPALADYRRITRALRSDPDPGLPSNFAWQMAQLVASRASRMDTRLEQWLLRGLTGMMVLGAVVATAVYGAAWLQAVDSEGTGTAGWIAMLAACAGMTAGLEGLQRLRARRSGGRSPD